jgi:ATP-binding cassette subfamily B protein
MEKKKIKGIAKLRYIAFLLAPYWKYGKCYVIVTIIMAMFFQPLSAYLSTLLPQKAIDAVMEGAQRHEIIRIIGIYTLGIALITAAVRGIEIAYTKIMQMKITLRITNDVNEKALFTDYKYYDNPDFFTMFIFAQENFPSQANMAMQLFPELIKAIMTMTVMGAMIAQAGPVLLGVAAFFAALTGVIALPTIKPQVELNVKITENWRPLDYVSRMLKQKENAAELRSSGAGLKFLQKVYAVIAHYQLSYQTYMKKTLPFFLTQSVITPIKTACILAYVVLFIIDGDTSKIGLYASLTVAATTLAASLNSVGSTMNDLLQNTFYGERIATFFEAESEIEPPNSDATPPPSGVYDIEFRDVSFGYESTTFAINHLSMSIKPGQRIAIVGENGAGKTTLTKLLLRLYDVTSGAVLINGRDIKEYDIHALRLHIGVAFQDVRVLAMSLRDNLTVYHDATDEQLMEVVRKLGLDGVVEKAECDLDKMVSREFIEDGIALSGGEAQRLSLARLFTGEFGLLVLDEPSSALDPLAEHKLMQTILDASNTATTIMVAHRLSTVRDFDMIYHMEDGKIIESGTHDELVSADGKYCEMFSKQAKNYRNAD